MVIKRDGLKEEFNFEKIAKSVSFAFKSVNVELTQDILDELKTFIDSRVSYDDDITIESIQDLIISFLKKKYKKVAKSFKDYREQRSKIRDSKFNGKYYQTIFDLIQRKQNETSVENANKDAKQMHVIRDLIAGEQSKKMYREHIMPARLKELHDEGIIHVHDCDYRLQNGMTNCGLVNLEDVLNNGTVMNEKLIESPHSLRTAATIATQVIAAVGSSQYGGITISLTHLAPYLRVTERKIREKFSEYKIDDDEKEKIVKRELNDELRESVQTINYQLNTMSTTNGQSPFITIFCYADENPEYKKETTMLIKELLKQRIEGMKSPFGFNINPTFPKLVYVLTENNINENHEDFELTKLAAECTCKRMVPDYMSEKKAKEYKEGCVIPPMGCRSFLSPWKNEKGEYQIYGRMNTGVISINLPYLALSCETLKDFYKKLEELIVYLCKQQKKIYDFIANSSVDIAPILWKYGVYGRSKDGLIKQHIDNMKCSVSIGYMGIAEAVERFGVHYNSKKGHELGIDIIKKMFDVVNTEKDKYGIALGLYGTPAESLITKFAKACKKFDVIEKVNDRDFITNSYHIPVEEEIDGFSKIEFESEFQKYSHNGAISYIEMGDVRKNPEAVIEVLKFIYEKMMYCEINTKSCSVCYKCGFEGEILMEDYCQFRCPNCGNTNRDLMNVILRLCGYLGLVQYGTSIGRWFNLLLRKLHF